MKILLIFFTLTAQLLFPFTLQEKFEQGEPGSYFVTEQNKLVSLLHLHSKKEGRLLFEEISIPLHRSKTIDWAAWIAKGAPGHTSWILYEIDTRKRCVTACYSLTRKAWMTTDELDAFLIPLLSLELLFLPESARLQKGATERAGNISSRPWGPPQVKQGKKVNHPEYDVYTAQWPRDSSDLSEKQMILYFDKNDQDFPFPYWIQTHEGMFKFKVRAIDSGKGLRSPFSELP